MNPQLLNDDVSTTYVLSHRIRRRVVLWRGRIRTFQRSTLKMERWRQHGPLKRWYPTTTVLYKPEDIDWNHHRHETSTLAKDAKFLPR